jgi:hypothetical protein
MKHIILLLVAMLSFTGCSFLYYGSDERTLMVVDLHPGGESIAFTGELEGVGQAELNREQGSSEAVISGAVDNLTGIPGL